MTGQILQRPEGITEGDRGTNRRDQNNESQHRERDRLRHHGPSLLGSSEGFLCDGKYLLNWPFLSLTDPLLI